MNDTEIMDGLLYEHEAARQHSRALINAVDEKQKLFHLSLETWNKDDDARLKGMHTQLRDAMDVYEQGLIDHILREEKSLFPFLNQVLIKAVETEHHDIIRYVRSTKALVFSHVDDSRSREEKEAENYQMRHSVEDTVRFVEIHTTREDGLFNLLKKGIAEKTHARK